MNISVFLINIARRAAERARQGMYESQEAILEAIVFAWFAVEALVNEQAYIEIQDFKQGSPTVYAAVERGAQGWSRIQTILTYLYGRGLQDGQNPLNDLKHLANLRNGLVHYRFENPPAEGTLNDLAQRGYLTKQDQPWNRLSMPWVSFVKPELAAWAYCVACDTGLAIAELLPKDKEHQTEAGFIRNNFEKDWPPKEL